MDLDAAIAKLREYTICGLAHNLRDTSQADEWLKIVKDAIEEEPPNNTVEDRQAKCDGSYKGCTLPWKGECDKGYCEYPPAT